MSPMDTFISCPRIAWFCGPRRLKVLCHVVSDAAEGSVARVVRCLAGLVCFCSSVFHPIYYLDAVRFVQLPPFS